MQTRQSRLLELLPLHLLSNFHLKSQYQNVETNPNTMPPKKKARTKKEKKSASSSSSSKVPIKTGPTWNDVFLNSVVFDNLCTFLNPRDLFALRATTKQLSDSFDTLFKTQWNINRSLGRFSRDPVQFRSMMAKCDALISGSFALQFFARTVWMDSDLDIYIESYPEVKIKTFGEYLAAEEGYALDNTKGIHDYSDHNKNVVKVWIYLAFICSLGNVT